MGVRSFHMSEHLSIHDSELLKLTRHGHTLVITISHPPANTWTKQSLDDLSLLIRSVTNERDIYTLIITGEGDKFFSAGADLSLFADGDPETARVMAHSFGTAFEALSEFRGLTIAAINGYAMGGGLEVAMACDLRIAESQAKMALPEASVGLLPCAGGTQNLPHLVGEGWAKRMILCGERVDADTAAKIGLVEVVVETGEALTTALAWAKQAEKQSPLAVGACKRLIQHGRKNPMWQGLEKEREYFVSLFGTADQAEGVQAFLEKRAPVWRNS
ncbi:enoyl-CoA hydratase [Corallincola spongiicola]|uniref:Enoyl-CoA hydratase n=2 Tax=Corallincola spongiicola TaxID=2520508 RepID=A0ABY1WTK9_9GAMM|nr:enoyl-CoA hydratase [Corallincola spongiicola]